MEVIRIDFQHFCRGIYNEIEGVSNQDTFVIEMFEASGSSYVLMTGVPIVVRTMLLSSSMAGNPFLAKSESPSRTP